MDVKNPKLSQSGQHTLGKELLWYGKDDGTDSRIHSTEKKNAVQSLCLTGERILPKIIRHDSSLRCSSFTLAFLEVREQNGNDSAIVSTMKLEVPSGPERSVIARDIVLPVSFSGLVKIAMIAW